MNKNSGFVAGTLVHTERGLVPIQDIKIRDWVLSRAEHDPKAELSYQRITETHQYENKSLYMLHVAEGFPERNEPKISDFFTMSNHPFWKVGVGWVPADLLKIGDEILLGNGKKAKVFGWSPVLRTKNLKTGWIASNLEAEGEMNATSNGYLIDFSNNKIVTPFHDYEQWSNADVVYWDYATEDLIGERFSYWAYSDTVYNITVENAHTYFVGAQGVWVHQ